AGFGGTVLAAMPDIEAMELVDRFFEVGTLTVGTDHAVAIFLAGCREALSEWEAQATEVVRRLTQTEPAAQGIVGTTASAVIPWGGAGCPPGQTARGAGA